MWSHLVDCQFICLCCFIVVLCVYVFGCFPCIEIYFTCHLYGCLSKCLFVRLSVRSSHQLPVADSSAVSSLERTAAAAGAQRGDQQETAGEKQREARFSVQ